MVQTARLRRTKNVGTRATRVIAHHAKGDQALSGTNEDLAYASTGPDRPDYLGLLGGRRPTLARRLGLPTSAHLDNPDRYWSWFEELYKTCKPSQPGKYKPARVYDGSELEDKFCSWVVDKRLPKAEQVRKLAKILENNEAIKVLEESGIERAMETVAEDDPTVTSKLWRQVQTTAEMLATIPLPELDDLRRHDAAKTKIFEDLSKAVERIRKETMTKK